MPVLEKDHNDCRDVVRAPSHQTKHDEVGTEPRELLSFEKMLTTLAGEGDNALRGKPAADSATVYDASEICPIPILDYIKRWLAHMPDKNTCTLIIAAILIDRFLERTHARITNYNIHRVVLSSLCLASKIYEDQPMTNTFYAHVGGVSVEELSRLEMTFSMDLDFRLFITREAYDAALKCLTHSAPVKLEALRPQDEPEVWIEHYDANKPLTKINNDLTCPEVAYEVLCYSFTVCKQMMCGAGPC